MAVSKMPTSGKSDELLKYEVINWDAIVAKVKAIV
jgi:hypothetical protein